MLFASVQFLLLRAKTERFEQGCWDLADCIGFTVYLITLNLSYVHDAISAVFPHTHTHIQPLNDARTKSFNFLQKHKSRQHAYVAVSHLNLASCTLLIHNIPQLGSKVNELDLAGFSSEARRRHQLFKQLTYRPLCS